MTRCSQPWMEGRYYSKDLTARNRRRIGLEMLALSYHKFSFFMLAFQFDLQAAAQPGE
jgi:hypothetical protein